MALCFSVVIPTHERRQTALLAVRSALAQTRRPLEVMVLADGCTDGTVEAVSALGDERVRTLELPKGPGFAYGHRNEAMRRARGDAIAWLADDDLWLPDHLERVGALLDAGCRLAQGRAALVDSAGRLELMGADWRIPRHRELLRAGRNATPMSAVAHELAPALAVGGWDAERPRHADLVLWRDLLDAGAHGALDPAVTCLHLRGSGRTQSGEDRIVQSSELLSRIEDPRGLAELRAELAELVAWREEALQQAHDAAQDAAAVAREEVAALRAVLARTYAGGWWRLRERVRRITRRAG